MVTSGKEQYLHIVYRNWNHYGYITTLCAIVNSSSTMSLIITRVHIVYCIVVDNNYGLSTTLLLLIIMVDLMHWYGSSNTLLLII